MLIKMRFFPVRQNPRSPGGRGEATREARGSEEAREPGGTGGRLGPLQRPHLWLPQATSHVDRQRFHCHERECFFNSFHPYIPV